MVLIYNGLKQPGLEKYGFISKSEAIHVLVDYLNNYYDRKRIHSSLNYLTPYEYVHSSN
jgi:putative transposase